MIIKDTNDVYYSLTKTKLATLPNDQGQPEFYILFADVRKHRGRTAQLYAGAKGPDFFIRVGIGKRNIGCREFEPKVMALIKKAIKGAK